MLKTITESGILVAKHKSSSERFDGKRFYSTGTLTYAKPIKFGDEWVSAYSRVHLKLSSKKVNRKFDRLKPGQKVSFEKQIHIYKNRSLSD